MTAPPTDTAPLAPGQTGATATWLAERALLGTLLRHPDRITTLRTWLQPDNFTEPTHQAIYATIDGLNTAADLRTVDPAQPAEEAWETVSHNARAVHRALQSGRFADATPCGYQDLLDLHHTAGAARPDQTARYGRMILETSIRHQLRTWAVATEPATTANFNPAEGMLSRLTELINQAHQSTGHFSQPLATTTSASPADGPATVAAPPRTLVERAEHQLIHAAITNSDGGATPLITRFHPDDFVASTAHAYTWQAIRALAHRGEPIDPVTVAWECETQAADSRPTASDDTALSPAELGAMTTEPAGNLDRAAATVARAALHHHTHQARRAVANASTQRRTSLDELLTTAYTTGTELRRREQRLNAAIPHHPPTDIHTALTGERPVTAPPNLADNRARRPRT